MNTSIVSLGQAAALIQAMPSAIRKAAEEMDIKPALRINMIDHYDEHDIERIAEYLRAHSTK